MRNLILLLILSLPAFGQSSTARNPNYGANKMAGGATLPATCTESQLYFKTSATKGVYQCVSGAWRRLVDADASGNVSIAPTLPVTVATTSPQTVTLTGFFWNNSAGAMTFNLPAITASTVGNQYCFENDTTRTGAITLQLPAETTVSIDGAAGTAASTLVSSGALGDRVCVVAKAVGKYMGYVGSGTWTKN